MVNVNLFRKIDRVFTGYPEQHDQGSWESVCGTTRCVAGWAIYIATGGQPLYNTDAYRRLCRELGIPGALPSELGAALLNLNARDAGILFYDTTNLEARQAVRLAATGDTDGFHALLERIRAEQEGE